MNKKIKENLKEQSSLDKKDQTFIDNDGDAINKNHVKNILKEEKRQIKIAKQQKKQQKKERDKKRKIKIKELIKHRKLEEKKVKEQQEQTIRELDKRSKVSSWFRLDNAASIYPSAAEKNWNFVVRISAIMKEKIDPILLQSAVDDIMPRFPSFNVRLCHGFFWNYYERNFTRLKVQRETEFPCSPFNLNDNNAFLVRVLYNDYKIILELFHGIADGRGAIFFFNSLLARYIEKCGALIKEYKGCSNYLDYPSEEEVEDSFFKHYTKEKIKGPKEKAAFKIRGNQLPKGMVNSIEGVMSVSKVKEVAKQYGVTISTLLAAVVGYCVYKRSKNSKKPTRISIPIDLRTRFDSITLRNFSSYINVEISGQNLSFEDVLAIFNEKLSNIDNKFLQANINNNVKLQKNVFIKLIPLFIKNFILKTCFNYLGENYQTLAFSNVGRVDVPKEFDDYVESYSVNVGRSLHNEKSIGVISYKDKLNMCISSKIYETETEKDIFKMLTKLDIPVKVYSNRRDLYGTR